MTQGRDSLGRFTGGGGGGGGGGGADLGSLGTAFVNIRGVFTGFNRDMRTAVEDVGMRLQAMGQRLRRIGGSLSKWITAPLIALGAAAGRSAVQFGSSMRKITALVGVSREQVNAWRDDLRKMAPDVGRSLQELGEGLFFVTSAGFRGDEALDVLRQSAKGAAAGLGETAVVADATTSAVNAYGAANLSASKAVGILVATVREGKAEANTIAPTLGKVIPIAAELGVSFDQVGAAIAAMTRIGLDAFESTTALRGMLTTIMRPSEDARAALAEFGLSAEELRRSLREDGLLATLHGLREVFGENEEALSRVFPNARAMVGVLSLAGQNAEQARAIFRSLADETGGSLNQAFKETAEGPGFQIKAAIADIAAALEKLGEAVLPVVVPVLQDFAEVIRQVGDWFGKLSPEGQRAAVVIGIIAAAIGPALVALGGLVTAAGVVVSALAAMGSGFVMVLGAIALVVAAIVGVGGLAWAWFQLPDSVRASLKDTLSAIGESFLKRLPEVAKATGDLIHEIAGLFFDLEKPLGESAKEYADALQRGLVIAWDHAIGPAVKERVSWLQRTWSAAVTGLKPIFRAYYDTAKTWLADKFEGVAAAVQRWAFRIGQIWGAFVQDATLEFLKLQAENPEIFGGKPSHSVGVSSERGVFGLDGPPKPKDDPVPGPGELPGMPGAGASPDDVTGAGDRSRTRIGSLNIDPYLKLRGAVDKLGQSTAGGAERMADFQRALAGAGVDVDRLGDLTLANLSKMRDELGLTATDWDTVREAQRAARDEMAMHGTFLDGLKAGLADVRDGFQTIGQLGRETAGVLADGFRAFARDASTGFQNVEEIGNRVLQRLTDALIEFAAQKAVFALLNFLLPGSGTALSGVFGALQGGGGATGAAHGGVFKVGGSGALDSRRVMMDLTPGEKLIAVPPGKMADQLGIGGGQPVEVHVHTAQGVPVTTRREDQGRRLMIAIGEDVENGGPVGKAITRTFEVRRRGRGPA